MAGPGCPSGSARLPVQARQRRSDRYQGAVPADAEPEPDQPSRLFVQGFDPAGTSGWHRVRKLLLGGTCVDQTLHSRPGVGKTNGVLHRAPSERTGQPGPPTIQSVYEISSEVTNHHVSSCNSILRNGSGTDAAAARRRPDLSENG